MHLPSSSPGSWADDGVEARKCPRSDRRFPRSHRRPVVLRLLFSVDVDREGGLVRGISRWLLTVGRHRWGCLKTIQWRVKTPVRLTLLTKAAPEVALAILIRAILAFCKRRVERVRESVHWIFQFDWIDVKTPETYLLSFAFIRPLILMINTREVRYDHRHCRASERRKWLAGCRGSLFRKCFQI